MVPQYIVIHHSLTADGSTVSWQAIRKYHIETKGWQDIGYHYGIELVNTHYEVLLGRMPNVVGAHCKEEGMNHKSWGICVVGNYDLVEPPTQQFDLLVRLVRGLREIGNIPFENVVRHSDYAPKTCPGLMFPWQRFKQLI